MEISENMVSAIDDCKSDVSISNNMRICTVNDISLENGEMVEYGSVSSSMECETGSGMNLVKIFTHNYDRRDAESEMHASDEEMFSCEDIRLRQNNYHRCNNLNDILSADFSFFSNFEDGPETTSTESNLQQMNSNYQIFHAP